MIRVHVICEGQTEASFVREVMQPHFWRFAIELPASLLGRPGRKGGNVGLDRILFDVRGRLLSEREAYCTTLFDFYALPTAFPGREEASRLAQCNAKANCITAALTARLTESIGGEAMRRFIPYVQMHEFEGLLFSQPEQIAVATGQPGLTEELESIRQQFASPEEINDGPQTAPSKRIGNLCRGYQKVLHGTLAASQIGLAGIRAECQLFDAWVRQLEALAFSN